METQEKTYPITGMTCGSCVAKVTDALTSHSKIEKAEVSLSPPQAKLRLKAPLTDDELKSILQSAGNYDLGSGNASQQPAPLPSIGKKKESIDLPSISLSTYKPLLLIVGFIAGVSTLVQYPFADFSGMLWMRHFMAGFFLVFSFFKLLNIQGFASSYRMYDLIAARWHMWGYIYPFVELALGIAYLINFEPFYTNLTTAIVLGISSIGVIESNLNKRKIKCACLGDVFNLPMSTVTIIEDLTMVAMAVWMLFTQ
ncbi:heavy-metal-associated domain-containing protein [Marinoscillum furvescens]|uniref:Copper chaperone CopZ n=1 Tax=Marinoscillum furvescens DSM 4134 TaxID=1122208 RepID=A0A3D9L2F2_MARFU|nr:heavy-metal-associated domain-containing protein [Marinoscillum furvescens]RED96959.1 copper chaperone CopZ [Marinoscillum furvescens DSM 4134]